MCSVGDECEPINLCPAHAPLCGCASSLPFGCLPVAPSPLASACRIAPFVLLNGCFAQNKDKLHLDDANIYDDLGCAKDGSIQVTAREALDGPNGLKTDLHVMAMGRDADGRAIKPLRCDVVIEHIHAIAIQRTQSRLKQVCAYRTTLTMTLCLSSRVSHRSPLPSLLSRDASKWSRSGPKTARTTPSVGCRASRSCGPSRMAMKIPTTARPARLPTRQPAASLYHFCFRPRIRPRRPARDERRWRTNGKPRPTRLCSRRRRRAMRQCR